VKNSLRSISRWLDFSRLTILFVPPPSISNILSIPLPWRNCIRDKCEIKTRCLFEFEYQYHYSLLYRKKSSYTLSLILLFWYFILNTCPNIIDRVRNTFCKVGSIFLIYAHAHSYTWCRSKKMNFRTNYSIGDRSISTSSKPALLLPGPTHMASNYSEA